MRFSVLVASLAMAVAGAAHAQTPALPSIDPTAPDPFAWLEDIHSPRALDWVKTENAKTAQRLETDPRYETLRREALAVFTTKDRIPFPGFLAHDVDNVWQDDAHVKGVWRRTTPLAACGSTPLFKATDRGSKAGP